jgi:hypothetical protein
MLSATEHEPGGFLSSRGYRRAMADLDFWLGRWEGTWEGGSAVNVVTRELDDRVVVERFEARPPERFTGTSLSVPDRLSGEWRQTWVDSTGSYWAFAGGPRDDGTFVLGTPDRVDEEQVYKRMVFADIAADSFSWRWESSPDGATWDLRWAISYRRLPDPTR